MGVIGRALSVISNMGRGPRATRGRSAERTTTGAPQPPSGDSDGDSSSYGSDVRVHENPVAQEPRIPASQRPEVPLPPAFHEDEIFLAGFQMGAAVQAQQDQVQAQHAHIIAQLGGLNFGPPPLAANRPPEEPDPELPGAGEPPSEPPTEAGSTQVIDDDSDAETLGFNETEDRSDHPDNTDNDPYEEAEHPEGSEPDTVIPEGSQADARIDPDITHIDIDDLPDEAQEPDAPEQPSQGEETPEAAI